MGFLVGISFIIIVTGSITIATRPSGRARWVTLVIGTFVGALWTVILSVSPIKTGHVGVAKWFGAVQPTSYPEGLRFMNPMYDVTQISIQRGSVDFTDRSKSADGPTVVAISLDRNPVRVEASFPYAINPASAWKLLQRVGSRDTFEQ